MITFRQFLAETAQVSARLERAAIDMLDIDKSSERIETSSQMADHYIDTAKEEERDFVYSAAGPWIISIFKVGDLRFARVTAPPGAGNKHLFFIVRKKKV